MLSLKISFPCSVWKIFLLVGMAGSQQLVMASFGTQVADQPGPLAINFIHCIAHTHRTPRTWKPAANSWKHTSTSFKGYTVLQGTGFLFHRFRRLLLCRWMKKYLPAQKMAKNVHKCKFFPIFIEKWLLCDVPFVTRITRISLRLIWINIQC